MRRLDIIFRIVGTAMRHVWDRVVPLFSAMGSHGTGGASRLTIVGLVGIGLIALGALVACPTEEDEDDETVLPAPTISSVDAADTDEGSGSPVTITLNIALPASVSGASIGYNLAGEGTASPADVADFSGASLTGLTATATIGSNRAVLTFTTVAALNDDDGNEQARVTVTGIAFTPTGEAENISGATANNSATFTITPAPLPMPTISSVSAADTGEGSGSSVTITLDLALPSSVSGASIGYDLAGEGTGGATAADVADFSGASLTGLTATATIGSNRAELTFATMATLNDGDGNEQARVTVTGVTFTPDGEAENISGATANNSDAFTITPAPPAMPTISSVSASDTDEGSGSPVTITLDLALPASVGGASVGYDLAGDATGGATAADVADFSGVSLTGLTETATIGSNRAELTFTTVATLDDGDGDEQARVTVTGITFTPTGQAENISRATENNSATFTIGADPVFSGAPYGFGIAEGSYSTSSPGAVGTVSAMPATRYAITAGDADNRFAIDAASGTLTAVDELDFETTPSYTLTVTAHNGADNDDPSATAMVEITVTDIQNGMADEPWHIDSVTELQSIDTAFVNDYTTANSITLDRAQSLAAHYLLTADLDLTGHDPDGDGSGFNPIGDCVSPINTATCSGGTIVKPFRGSFDGGGYTISNLTINRPSLIGVGLFANITNGSVHHLFLEDVNISGENHVGGIVGISSTNSLLYFVAVTGTINTHLSNGGGIAGTFNTSQAFALFANVSMPQTNNQTSLIGASGGNDIFNAHTAGTVRGTNSSSISNGLGTFTVRNAYGRSVVMDGTGGVVGFLQMANELQATNVYWDTDTTGKTRAIGFAISGIPPDPYPGITGLNTAGMQGLTASASGWQTQFSPGIDLDGDGDVDDTDDVHLSVRCDVDGDGMVGATEWLWDFGTASQYPALNCMPISLTEQRAANRQ